MIAELDQPLAYTTVLTVLRGLEAKGAVRHQEEGRAYRYRPRITASKAGAPRLDRLLEQVYQGSRELLLARLVSDRDISREELKRLRRLVDERMKEADR